MATALVIGNMVGSGLFLLPASLAPYGAYSLSGWGFSAGGALLLARVFGRLARRQPQAGGPYAYTRAGFGDFAGFLVAWGYWLSIVAANAAIAVAFASYLAVFFPALAATPLLGALAALAAVWALTLVNVRGVRTAGSVQVVTTFIKLAPLLALVLAGAVWFDPQVLTAARPAASPASAVDACVALTLWAFLGLESATIPADHVRDPARTIPRATLLGTLIAALFYVACTTIVMGVVPAATLAHSTAPFAAAGQALWGPWAGGLIAATAAISCFGALNGWVLMVGQLPQAVAKDGLFPALFARESRRRTPVSGLLLAGVLTSILVLMNYSRGLVAMFTFIILLSTLSTLIPYLFCSLAELMMSRREAVAPGARARHVVLVGGAFAFALWAIKGAGGEAVGWGLLLLLAGVPVYLWQSRRRGSVQPDA